MDFKVLLGDNSTIIIHTREIIYFANRTYYMCTNKEVRSDLKVRTVQDLNKINRQMHVENFVILKTGGEYRPEKIVVEGQEVTPQDVRPYHNGVDSVAEKFTAKFNEVIDPYGTSDDADNASRDRYYFKQGMKAAFQLLIEREFNFEEFQQNHPHEVSMFSSAVGCFRSSLRVGDNVLKEDLKMMIERL